MRIVIVLIALAIAGCGQRVVTRTVQVERVRYVALPSTMLPAIDAPAPAASIDTNGGLWRAWLHDSRELGKCKPALDGIRTLQPR